MIATREKRLAMNQAGRWLIFSSIFAVCTGCLPKPDTPLGRAAARGDMAELNRLIAGGASLAERDEALVWAARGGAPQSIHVLIKSGADPDFRAGVNDWPVLMHAIHKNQPEAVTALLESGANPNLPGRNGETPLMMAAGYGYANIVRALLEHKADAQTRMQNGENALDFALNGVSDIDKFTWGKCQSESVQVIRAMAPQVVPSKPEKLKNCAAGS